MPSTCKCHCGTRLLLKDGKTGEAKAKVKLLITMQTELTYICQKCGYKHQSHSIMIK